MKNKNITQKAAGAMAVFLLASSPAFSAAAAAPQVSVDETMYVTMDFYGQPDQVTVVKACTPNGNKEYTDYGNYTYVTNMSGYEEPDQDQGQGQIQWDLTDVSSRFYYECGLETSQIRLPWSFDISYRLNGIQVKAEDLAGAKGLVVITIKAIPETNARTYDKNNMILLTAVPVDMGNENSILAPGGQIQSIGSMEAAVFTLLPSEEGEFTVSIGTDCFETTGIMFMMMPGTSQSFNRIKDLKEVRDTWEESGDAMYQGVNQMMRTVEAMEDGVREMYSGLQSIDQARERASQSGDDILAENDQTIQALTRLNEQMETLIPDLQTAKEASGAINKDMNELVNNVGELKRPLWILEENLYRLEDNTDDIADITELLQGSLESLIQIDDKIQENIEKIDEGLSSLEGIEEISGALDKIYGKMELINRLGTQSNALRRKAEAALDHGGNEMIETGILASQAAAVIEETEDLNKTLNLYEPQLQEALGDCQLLISSCTEALDSGISTMETLQSLLRDIKNPAEKGAKESLAGTLAVMDKTISMFGDTKTVREAAESMKTSFDNEKERLDSETSFLNIDPSARKLSFTSEKNNEPNSLQIVMRTGEISLDDQEAAVDMETEAAPENPFVRMWKVLVKICYAVIDIFRNR